MTVHLVKLCVGCGSVDELEAWRRSQRPSDWRLRTRQTPKRVDDLLDGGSLYWVFKGAILCRQGILAIDTVGEGVDRWCEIDLDPIIVRTCSASRRPFQGWRYLPPEEAPGDLSSAEAPGQIPAELVGRLRELGAW